MALPDPLPLTDNSSGTPATLNFIRIANSGETNDQTFRQVTPFDPADVRSLMTSFKVSKGGIVRAAWSTQRRVSLNGFQNLMTVSSAISIPQALTVMTMAQVRSLLSTHGSFIKTSAAITDTDLVMRLLAGEI